MRHVLNDLPDEIATVPLRPIHVISTAHPAQKAAGRPIKLNIICYKDSSEMDLQKKMRGYVRYDM